MARVNGMRAPVDAKGNPVVRAAAAEDKDLVLVRQWFREAIEESGWKKDAVAAAMTEHGAKVDAPYLSKLLSGDKAITAKHIRALPDAVEAIYARKQAESFGQIVVEPVTGEQAIRNLVSGLCGVLPGALPMRASRMAKCGTQPREDV